MVATPKKPVWKKWWFWGLVVLFLIIVSAGSNGSQVTDDASATQDSSEPSTIVDAQPSPETTIDKLWVALDSSLRTRKGYDLQFTEGDGLVTLTDTPDAVWDETADVRRAYSDLVWFGAKAFEIDGVVSIRVVTRGSYTDQYGKSFVDDSVRLTMSKEEYRKYDWENLKYQPIWKQMQNSTTEYYIHPALIQHLNYDKLYLEAR